MKFDKLINTIIESSLKKRKMIRPEDSSIGERKMLKTMEKINEYIESILDLDNPIQKDIFDRIKEAENTSEYKKRMEWLSEGSLLYHTMYKEYKFEKDLNLLYTLAPFEKELYKKIVEHLNEPK
jgi:hypothetical protein